MPEFSNYLGRNQNLQNDRRTGRSPQRHDEDKLKDTSRQLNIGMRLAYSVMKHTEAVGMVLSEMDEWKLPNVWQDLAIDTLLPRSQFTLSILLSSAGF